MVQQVYFGTTAKAAWMACPATGMTRNKSRYMVELEYENSGADVVASVPYRNEYDMDFPVRDASDSGNIEMWKRMWAGEYGTGPFYLFDPMWADYNLFGAQWAAPGLIEQGWKNFGATTPTYANVGLNWYNKPVRAAVWNLTGTANSVHGKAFTFIIPTGYTLHLGGSGSVTGNAALRVLPAGGSASTITLSSEASAPAFSTTVAGSTYSSATVYMTRTSATNSTININSLWAQILPTGITPAIPRHLPGEGTTGLKFNNPVVAENYIMADRHLVGMSASLIETEQWQ